MWIFVRNATRYKERSHGAKGQNTKYNGRWQWTYGTSGKNQQNLIWAWKKQSISYKDFLSTTQRWQAQLKFVEISKEMMEWNCQK